MEFKKSTVVTVTLTLTGEEVDAFRNIVGLAYLLYKSGNAESMLADRLTDSNKLGYESPYNQQRLLHAANLGVLAQEVQYAN